MPVPPARMTSSDPPIPPRQYGVLVAAAMAGIALLAWVLLLGSQMRNPPAFCHEGLAQLGPRCCAPGQAVSAGKCVGVPDACPPPFDLFTEPTPGCVLPAEKIKLPGGSVSIGPTEWDTPQITERRTIAVRSFSLDRAEVTVQRYRECEQAGMCPLRTTSEEPGRPMVGLTPADAETYCAFVGGRLPTSEEWIFAAMSPTGRRYPWGPHGLVCRRAAFGLAAGPCAEGGPGAGPELAGARPDGATPEGIYDLAGNVAELTRSANGKISVRGGSFRSKRAAELKGFAPGSRYEPREIGFRCAYSHPGLDTDQADPERPQAGL